MDGEAVHLTRQHASGPRLVALLQTVLRAPEHLQDVIVKVARRAAWRVWVARGLRVALRTSWVKVTLPGFGARNEPSADAADDTNDAEGWPAHI
jgi:hypothetical protein